MVFIEYFSESHRKSTIYNALAVIRATRGKNIIISSGSHINSIEFLRQPSDVIYLCSLFDLKPREIRKCLSENPKKAVFRAYSRKYLHHGWIRMKPRSLTPLTKRKADEAADDSSTIG